MLGVIPLPASPLVVPPVATAPAYRQHLLDGRSAGAENPWVIQVTPTEANSTIVLCLGQNTTTRTINNITVTPDELNFNQVAFQSPQGQNNVSAFGLIAQSPVLQPGVLHTITISWFLGNALGDYSVDEWENCQLAAAIGGGNWGEDNGYLQAFHRNNAVDIAGEASMQLFWSSRSAGTGPLAMGGPWTRVDSNLANFSAAHYGEGLVLTADRMEIGFGDARTASAVSIPLEKLTGPAANQTLEDGTTEQTLEDGTTVQTLEG